MTWHIALALLAVLIIGVGSVCFFRAASYIERARGRRVENETLAHDAMIREENRQSAYAGRVVAQTCPKTRRT